MISSVLLRLNLTKMDKQKIINLANKGLELVEEMDRKSMYKNLLGNLFFEMRKEAINYTRCCETLEQKDIKNRTPLRDTTIYIDKD